MFRIATFAFPEIYGLLSQAGALAMLAAGIVYIVFSAKLEERDRSGQGAAAFPSGAFGVPAEQKHEEKVGPYQPPTAHV